MQRVSTLPLTHLASARRKPHRADLTANLLFLEGRPEIGPRHLLRSCCPLLCSQCQHCLPVLTGRCPQGCAPQGSIPQGSGPQGSAPLAVLLMEAKHGMRAQKGRGVRGEPQGTHTLRATSWVTFLCVTSSPWGSHFVSKSDEQFVITDSCQCDRLGTDTRPPSVEGEVTVSGLSHSDGYLETHTHTQIYTPHTRTHT